MTDPRALLSDEAFLKAYSELGPMELSRRTKMSATGIFKRRRNLERKLKTPILSPHDHQNQSVRPAKYPHRIYLTVDTGTVLVGSDAHIWPGPLSTAMRAFIKFCKDVKPKAVVLNGDVCDFPRVSRWDPIGWEHQPQVQEEIEAAQDILHQIEMAAGRGVKKVWTLGNHDARFETYLATVAPEYAKIHGVHLKDHFPNWEPCWTFWINQRSENQWDPGSVVVAHQYKGGEYAPRNNTIRAGITHISGHLHSAKVMPFSDYGGTRYGVDSGCLADVDHRAFVNYTRDAPKDWRSGFCVLTFDKGKMLQPELCLKLDEDSVEFRGEVIKV